MNMIKASVFKITVEFFQTAINISITYNRTYLQNILKHMKEVLFLFQSNVFMIIQVKFKNEIVSTFKKKQSLEL